MDGLPAISYILAFLGNIRNKICFSAHLYSTVYTEWPVIPRTNDMFYFKLVSKLFIDTFLALKTYSQGEGDKYQRSV